MDENSVPHLLLPVLAPTTGQEGSLANVSVPLDAIKPSEFRPGAEPSQIFHVSAGSTTYTSLLAQELTNLYSGAASVCIYHKIIVNIVGCGNILDITKVSLSPVRICILNHHFFAKAFRIQQKQHGT